MFLFCYFAELQEYTDFCFSISMLEPHIMQLDWKAYKIGVKGVQFESEKQMRLDECRWLVQGSFAVNDKNDNHSWSVYWRITKIVQTYSVGKDTPKSTYFLCFRWLLKNCQFSLWSICLLLAWWYNGGIVVIYSSTSVLENNTSPHIYKVLWTFSHDMLCMCCIWMEMSWCRESICS